MAASSKWRFAFGTAFFVVLVFIWGNEVVDFPHILLGAPNTPVNWQESIIETVFAIIFGSISYGLILNYEKKWLGALGELQKLAALDPLTGVLNRREFIERTSMEFSRSTRSGIPFIMVLIDFDNFKDVNDQFGHLCGDKILTGYIAAIKRNVRQHDLVGRLGGDEFGVVLTGVNGNDVTATMRRINEEWNKTEILGDAGQKIAASVSMGVTAWDEKDAALEDVIRRADMLLYRAKGMGKNRIEVG